MTGHVGTVGSTQLNNRMPRPVFVEKGSSYAPDMNMNISAGAAAADRGYAKRKRSKVRTVRRVKERNDKRFMLLLAAMIVAGLFVMIGMRCYGATIQHANNELEEKNSYIQAEIDSLQSQIVEKTKVTTIESLATEQYGMIYPTADNCIRFSADDEEKENLAATIRSEAYN